MDILQSVIRIGAFVLILMVLYFASRALLKRLFRRRLPQAKKRRFASLLLTASALVSAVLLWFSLSNFYVYHGFGFQPDIFRHGKRSSHIVALTFDDGPSPLYTPQILDILDRYEVKATFFLVGSHVDKYPEIARRIVDSGHELGNHTQSHRNVPTLGQLTLHNEIINASAAIFHHTGSYPSYVRPPRGMYDDRFRRLAWLLGQDIVLWSLSGRDWQPGVTSRAIVENVVPKAKGGEILLFHDSGALIKDEGGDRSATIRALPLVIEGLRAKGLSIVPLSELLSGTDTGETNPRMTESE